MAIIFLDRLDDVQFAPILVVLHPLHILAEAHHHPGHHVLHGDLFFNGKGDAHLDAAAFVEFDRERVLRVTPRRPGRLLRLAAVTLHLHNDLRAFRIIRIYLRQTFQLGQIFGIDIAVKLEQRTSLIVVITRQLVQVVEFPLHVDNGSVHEIGDFVLRVYKIETAEKPVKYLIEGRDVIDVLNQCQAQQLPG